GERLNYPFPTRTSEPSQIRGCIAMNILVTAGNTQVPIDRVRALTNIFTGRTGAAIALEAYRRGHAVTLLTSHPEAVGALSGDLSLTEERWQIHAYCTFDDLRDLMATWIENKDAVIHSAAVSDYLAELMVANTLEGAAHWAFVGPLTSGGYEKIARRDLARIVIDAVEKVSRRA